MSEALKVVGVETGYGDMQVLWGASLSVERGEIVGILGPNGAGKSTLLRAVMGILKIWKGDVKFFDLNATNIPPHRKVEMGLTMVPEGRNLFSNMSVLENILMGAYLISDESLLRERLEIIHTIFPVLKERAHQKAGTLSGGEQQMLAIARALMTNPKVLLLDEPTQGLSPKLSKEVVDLVSRLRSELGVTILIVEEKIKYAMSISDRIYVLDQGRIVHETGREDYSREEEFFKKFLGL
ncbi:MAG: ABC transporter ATP-binding protein [Zestosphaera sp.]